MARKNTSMIYFSQQEAHVISMGIAGIIEDINDPDTLDQPWTPEARKARREILEACKSVAAKLEKFAGIKCDLPRYNPGDEMEFFTKES